ncbi:MAG TPA: hypothetical protein VF075_04400, partial [Pyrinomonadaceae bacterium]
ASTSSGFAKVENHCWIGSVQGAVATWSVIGMQYSRRILDSDGWTRSLPLPVLTRSNNDQEGIELQIVLRDIKIESGDVETPLLSIFV